MIMNAYANPTISPAEKLTRVLLSGEPGVEKSCIARLRRPLAAKPVPTAASRPVRAARRVNDGNARTAMQEVLTPQERIDFSLEAKSAQDSK
jgi:hypothetical protein